MCRKVLRAGLMVLPLAVAGFVYGKGLTRTSPVAGGYVCPVTGETLPCPGCCPLNVAPAAATPKEGDKSKAEEGYNCPLTGETLGCPGCCPLNQTK
jgi:hypothetical protein